MFQFCLKISCLPFLTVYSMLLTLLANEPCLALLLGLVMFPHEPFLILLLPLEHLQGAKAAPQPGQGSLGEPRAEILQLPPNPIDFPAKGSWGELLAAEKPVATFPSLGRPRALPFLPACCTPLCSAMGAVVLVLFLYKVLIIAIPLPFISTE